jgi:hypothetical protein
MPDDLQRAERERLTAMVERYARDLMSHFDAVQIFATVVDPDDGGTESVALGRGNWHARHGMIRDWVTANDARVAAHAIQPDDEDD